MQEEEPSDVCDQDESSGITGEVPSGVLEVDTTFDDRKRPCLVGDDKSVTCIQQICAIYTHTSLFCVHKQTPDLSNAPLSPDGTTEQPSTSNSLQVFNNFMALGA